MIICLCKGISVKAIRAAVAKGLTQEEFVQESGFGKVCRTCLEDFSDVWHAAEAEENAADTVEDV